MEISKAELASAAAAQAPAALELRGAEILVKALQAENVKYVWGYPGGAVLHIYDAFYKQDTIQHILAKTVSGLRVVAEPADAAAALLKGIPGLEVAPDPAGGLRIDCEAAQFPDINRRLVQAGIAVKELSPVRLSLEEFFLSQ